MLCMQFSEASGMQKDTECTVTIDEHCYFFKLDPSSVENSDLPY